MIENRARKAFNEPLHRRTLLASGGGRIYMTCPHGPSPAAPGRSLVIVLFRCRTSSQPYDFLKVHEQTRPCIYLYGGAYLYASMGLCINKQMATRGGRHEVKAPVPDNRSHTRRKSTHTSARKASAGVRYLAPAHHGCSRHLVRPHCRVLRPACRQRHKMRSLRPPSGAPRHGGLGGCSLSVGGGGEGGGRGWWRRRRRGRLSTAGLVNR